MTNLNPAPHFGLVLDCADPERLAEFWAEALGYANVGSAGVYVARYPREGNGPKLLLQRVTDQRRPRIGCTSTSRFPTSRWKPTDCPASAHNASAATHAANTAAPGS